MWQKGGIKASSSRSGASPSPIDSPPLIDLMMRDGPYRGARKVAPAIVEPQVHVLKSCTTCGFPTREFIQP
jgi:hypothetical protein